MSFSELSHIQVKDVVIIFKQSVYVKVAILIFFVYNAQLIFLFHILITS